MEISKRDVTKEELDYMLKDFRKIEIEYNIPETNQERLNVTVDEDGKIIGFASGLINLKWFILSDLWIDERYRGQKLGAKILKMLEEDAKAKGMTHIYTWTSSFNSNEIFYEKQGFKINARLKDYFGDGNGDHVLLTKEL